METIAQRVQTMKGWTESFRRAFGVSALRC